VDCETVYRHFIQCAAGVDANYSRASIGVAGLREAEYGQLRWLLWPYGLLCGKTCIRFTACACRPDTIQRSESSFPACSEYCRLDVAGKFGGFNFFHESVAVAGDGRAALHAELFPASLSHSSKRP
jgi:hypothetical protein